MTELARAFWTVAPGRGEIRAQTLQTRAPGDVLVRAIASGISRGTESLVFRGLVPESQYAAMRCPLQEGEFPGPVKYGYASVGVIEAGPDGLPGQRVFCLHPHQDRYIVPAEQVHLLAPGVPDARATLAANMETAVNGLWDAAPRVGDRIAVIGAGVVGCLVAALAARVPGTRVQIVDIDARRAAIAERLGCAFALPAQARPDADLVVHASGHPDGLGLALTLAGFEATILEMSWYGTRPVSVPLGEAFHARRLEIKSSQVGAVSDARRARWSYRQRMALALELLADPVFDVLLTGTSAFDTLPDTLARLSQAPDGALCHVITYP